MSRLPSDVGRYALWRKEDGGRYWTGETVEYRSRNEVQRRPLMTVLVANAATFPTCAAAYAAAANIKGLLAARPVRVS